MVERKNCTHPEYAVVDGKCTHCNRILLGGYAMVFADSVHTLNIHTNHLDLDPATTRVRIVKHADHLRGFNFRAQRVLLLQLGPLTKAKEHFANVALSQGFEVLEVA